jgi:hypothetical protein
MWNEPYLETCCRSALHRLLLVGSVGRPPGLKDGPCLTRLQGMGLAMPRSDGRWEVTSLGQERHGELVMRRRAMMAGGAVAAGAADAPAR